MADDQRTLTLTIKAEIEAARQQLDGLALVLGTTAQQVDQRLTGIEQSFSKADRTISTRSLALATTIGSSFGSVIGNLVSQIPSALQNIATSAIESAGSIKNTSEALGISTDALQDFRIGAVKAGVDVGQADRALEAFQKTSGRAAQGNREALASFKAVGVQIADSNGNLKPFEQLVREVADGLAKLPDPARQSAAAVKLFGDNGDNLLPFLTAGSKGMNDLAAASEALGMKLSPETINKLDELGNKADAIKKIITTQLAAAIGENADAFLALGEGAQAAIAGVGGFIRTMAGWRKIQENEGFLAGVFSSDAEKKAAATGDGMRIRLQKKVAGARADLAEAVNMRDNGTSLQQMGTGSQPNVQQRRSDLAQAEQLLARYNYQNPIVAATDAPAPTPGGKVTPPAVKPTRVAKPKKAPAGFDLRGGIDGVLAGPGSKLGVSATGDEVSKTLAELDGSARTLRETLNKVFDPDQVDSLIQKLPDLTSELDQVHLVSQQFVADLAGGIAGIITQSGNLGDKLISLFSNIGASMLQSGILNFLSGGEQGTSFGTLFKGVGKVTKLLAFANGGDPPIGVPSLVGEDGPELIVPRGAMTVISNKALRAAGRMASGGGAGAGGVTNYNDFRGAVVTEELYARIDATGKRAAQAGALGGRQLGAADQSRKQRRSMV